MTETETLYRKVGRRYQPVAEMEHQNADTWMRQKYKPTGRTASLENLKHHSLHMTHTCKQSGCYMPPIRCNRTKPTKLRAVR